MLQPLYVCGWILDAFYVVFFFIFSMWNMDSTENEDEFFDETEESSKIPGTDELMTVIDMPQAAVVDPEANSLQSNG